MLELTRHPSAWNVPCPSPLSNPVTVQVVLLVAPFALSGAELRSPCCRPTNVSPPLRTTSPAGQVADPVALVNPGTVTAATVTSE